MVDIVILVCLFALGVVVAAKREEWADFFVRVAGTMACAWVLVQIVKLLIAGN
jgi:hypothetical protein